MKSLVKIKQNRMRYINPLWARVTFRSHANTIFYQIILVFSQDDVYGL